ncbi:MAG: hypothetical protein KJ561_05125, partial [Nanoarchaeota archaeon]|nr:hypothetical protein [Nanoarchaeota archaeon]
MKQPILKAIAVFLIGIIISLPIYSSSVLAGLSNPKVYGADGIDGYLRKEETIFFNITAEIPGDSDITPSQVHLVDLSGPEFNACYSIGSNRFVCEYMMASSSISGDTFSFNALLYNDANALVPPKVAMRGAFDDLAPEIISFSISPSITRGGPVTIQYTVYDHSYSLTDIGRCSGINKVELSASGNIFNTTEFRTSPNSCERSGSLTVNITSITSIDGTIDITLTAYDNFDQASSAVAYITYDTSPPEIDISSLHIRDASNNEIEYVTDAPVNAKVSFAIPSPDLNPNSVYGDITEINKDSPPEYLHRQAACNLASDGGYNCTFNNIEVKLAQTTNVNIRINASDIAGNPSSAVLAKTINHDITGPAITIIRTELVDAGKSYVGNSLNTFIVEFSEEGIGVDKNSMRLDLSSVKTGLTNKAADECTSSACYWYNITADKSDGGKVISVLSSSSDKLNNLVTGSLAGNVTVDRTPPGQVSSNISSIGTGEEAIPGKIKTTDRISLKTKATEKSTLRAYADFSALITTQDNESGSCAKGDDDRWQCEWLSEPIDVPGMLQTTIPVTYTDFAGNSYTQSPQIKVYNYSSITSPSYWANSVSCSPLPVDRQITSLINYKVICSITLIPLTADQETLSISFENCEDAAEGSTAYIASAELLNANVGSTNPYLSFSLSKTEMRIDRISLKCPLNIKTRAGSQIMQYPETENIIVGISLYDMP